MLLFGCVCVCLKDKKRAEEIQKNLRYVCCLSMDRKWRTNRAAIQDVLSVQEFAEKVGEWNEKSALVSLTDLYAVYTVLHIEKKTWEVHWSQECQFYYFLATEVVESRTKRLEAPEGDEDIELMTAPEGAVQKETVLENFGGANREDETREETQLLVPVGSSNNKLTPELLHSIPKLGHGLVHQVILCLVDSHGVVTRCCIYDYIQAPLGGSGTAALQ